MFLLALILFAFIFVLLAFIVFSITILFSDFFLELPYVGANKKKVETIIKLANSQKDEVVVDLGSGDGRLLAAFAKKGAVAIGYELNPFLFWLSKFKTHKFSKKIIIRRESFWSANLKDADIVLIYSLKKLMPKFEEFIYKNANRGTRIVVNTNPFPNKKPEKQENGIFLYFIQT